MSNPRFAGSDLSQYALTATPGTNASYPLVNLLTYIARDQWRSAIETDPAELRIDMGTATARDFLAITNHNLASLGGNGPPRLQAADDNTYSTGLVTVVSDLSSTPDPGFRAFASVTKRYWRIKHDSGDPSSESMRIGNLFIDKVLDFGFPYDFGSNRNNAQYKTTETSALDGTIRTSQIYAGRAVWSIAFKQPGISDTVRAAFASHFAKVRGKLRPFYFVDLDDKIYYVLFDFDQDTTQDFRYNLSLLDKVTFKEQLATR